MPPASRPSQAGYISLSMAYVTLLAVSIGTLSMICCMVTHPEFADRILHAQVDQWQCILGTSSACARDDVILNINTVCDGPGGDFRTECPAPKAAIRVGELKLLAECYDPHAHAWTGTVQLFNLSADESEQRDISAILPADLHRLSAQLLPRAAEAAQVPPLGDRPPWQGHGYYCAQCEVGRPFGHGKNASWEPWCAGGAGVPCKRGR